MVSPCQPHHYQTIRPQLSSRLSFFTGILSHGQRSLCTGFIAYGVGSVGQIYIGKQSFMFVVRSSSLMKEDYAEIQPNSISIFVSGPSTDDR